MIDTASLQMLRIGVHTSGLLELARRRGLSVRDVDFGYAAHCLLGEVFGELAPRPFALSNTEGRVVSVLAYHRSSLAELIDHARSFADPWVHGLVDWTNAASKAMPTSYAGRRLGFEIRVCPVVRLGRGTSHGRPGAEVDVFLNACSKVDPSVSVSRESVYIDWLRARLDAHGTILEDAKLHSFHVAKSVRRSHESSRKSHVVERPDVRIRGHVRVVDERFCDLLTQGVGRHRAFGFGMLLLRAPET